MSRVCLAACLALLVAAPAAAARVIRAESVLAPGQSGFIGSPHLYDQVPLLTEFRFKPATFGQPAESVEEPRPGIRIERDAYGVPAITAATERDLWWAVGYATAQDRLAQIELFRRAAAGRLAELLGEGSLQDDVVARRDYYTDAELRRQLDRLPVRLRERFPAYAEGVNAWIEHVRATPADLPAEFRVLDVPLRSWTVLDSARIGVLLLRTVPSDDGNELSNLRALRAMGPRLFDRVLPLRVPGQATTIPTAAGRWPSQPGRTRAAERRAFRRSVRAVRGMPLPSTAGAARVETGVERQVRGVLGGQGSFMWAVRRRSDGHAFLVSGPQLGYNAPQRLHELELHAPGLNVRGVVPPGVPALAIGHNGRVAWGFTSALSDDDDLYAERLRAPGSEQYRFRGRWLRMRCRTEAFRYRDAGAMRSRRERLCRTIHGPVQARAGRVAYARRYAIWQREVDSVAGIDALNRATSLGEVNRAMRRMTWTENVLAADDRGNIGFWHPGNYPLRPRRFDERLPYPGTGRAEWRGLLPRASMPRVVNPPGRDWLVNWNNVPSADFTSGDNQAREQLNGPYHRVRLLTDLLGGAAAAPEFDRVTAAIIRESGTTATQRTAADALLRRLAARASGPAKTVLDTLVAWDGDYATTGDDGRVAPGVATWRAFKAAAQVEAFGATTPGRRELTGRPGGEGFVEATVGETYALRTLGDERLLEAAAAAAEALAERFATTDATRWREPRTMIEAAPLGLSTPPPIGLVNRGSWEQLVELGP
ncbi:MAG TPA: penicillin acylase family protein [Solirubrobacteraceae bacterium]|nr:penicillin acylase family protein [Solirubrobacteraceae bacterium]